MELGEAILLSGLGAAVAGLCAREACQFWRWRSNIKGLDRQEWARVMREFKGR